jgi:hypothetical protein
MEESRRLFVQNHVFTPANLIQIAGILDRTVDGKGTHTTYSVTFADARSIEGTASEVFSEDALSWPSPPDKIEMRLSSRTLGSIWVNLRPGEAHRFDNAIILNGRDKTWTQSTFTELRDALERARAPEPWIKRHRALLLALLTMSIFSFVLLVLRSASASLAHLSPSLSRFASYILNVDWFPILLMSIPAAAGVRSLLLSQWPEVEFDFGSIYARPKRRRSNLSVIWASIIAPILVNGVCFLLFR